MTAVCFLAAAAAPGAFALAAVALWRVGAFPIPVAGKTPQIQRFTRMPRPALATIEAWSRRWPAASVGIVTGPVSGTGLVVVDIDTADRAVLDAVELRFGDTPLKVGTPSGGSHWFFRYSGERCRNLRPELPVDVKAAGGFVVVPPSARSNGKPYTFLRGSWADLAALPAIREGALAGRRQPGDPVRLRAIGEGRRNNTLFRALLKRAPHCDDLEQLVDKARTINDDCDPSLSDAEVEKTARSAWRYEQEHRNWVGASPRAITTAAEIAALDIRPNAADAVYLLTKLKLAHGARAQPFAASPPAMARAGIAPGWAHARYRYALVALVAGGVLDIVHKGGSRVGDARLYAFHKSGVPPRTQPHEEPRSHPSRSVRIPESI
ncbi:MAG: bifunctional DNA primase/polymerase [Stellaceae bacterium]